MTHYSYIFLWTPTQYLLVVWRPIKRCYFSRHGFSAGQSYLPFLTISVYKNSFILFVSMQLYLDHCIPDPLNPSVYGPHNKSLAYLDHSAAYKKTLSVTLSSLFIHSQSTILLHTSSNTLRNSEKAI